jgi:hypothetical protein
LFAYLRSTCDSNAPLGLPVFFDVVPVSQVDNVSLLSKTTQARTPVVNATASDDHGIFTVTLRRFGSDGTLGLTLTQLFNVRDCPWPPWALVHRRLCRTH